MALPTIVITPTGPILADVADNITCATSGATGGTGPYTYQWKKNAAGGGYQNVAGQVATTFYFVPVVGDIGTTLIKCTVTDTGNGNVTADSNVISFTIVAQLTVDMSSPTLSSAYSMIVGETAKFLGVRVGGTSTWTLDWLLNNVSQSTNSTTFNWTPSATGIYTVNFKCTDSATTPDVVTSRTITVTVYSLYQTLASANGYLAKIAEAMS